MNPDANNSGAGGDELPYWLDVAFSVVVLILVAAAGGALVYALWQWALTATDATCLSTFTGSPRSRGYVNGALPPLK